MFEQSDVCGTNDDDDETTGNKSAKDDENGASCRTKITPNTNESDSESLARIKLANINHEDDTSTIISTISDDISEVRRLRTMNPDDWLTDERAQEVIQLSILRAWEPIEDGTGLQYKHTPHFQLQRK